MRPHVPGQVAGRRKDLAARRVLEWPLPAVHPHVHSQGAIHGATRCIGPSLC